MSEYLSKEEIRKWRSSLERITLEEYAARLGKVIQAEKDDDSLVDDVMFRSLTSMSTEKYTPKTEKIQSLAIKSFNKEKELKDKKDEKLTMQVKEAEKKIVESKKKSVVKTKDDSKAKNTSVEISFNKALTSREQLVFNHFMLNKNTIVYARDLAKILELPRDYVYKYIKNLRSKLNEDILQNADNGGYVLKVE
ncbi:MAG: helix-turn-helix domain-containing protein [Candidatus Gastranaerophilales bacterium]|nr:helix-turn-helix domain-containing protein [Candidatus Gastranaerophilales bacterium]